MLAGSEDSRKSCRGFVRWEGYALEGDDPEETVTARKSVEEDWEPAEENEFDDSSRNAAGKSLPAGQKPGAVCAAMCEEEFELAP
jgi:hypothetical protein